MNNLKPFIIPVLFIVVSVAGLVRLGYWQQTRMEEKAAHLNYLKTVAAVNPLDWEDVALPEHKYYPIHIEGRYDHARDVVLENQRAGNEAGYRLLTPFIIEGTKREVLVDRGWIRRQYHPDILDFYKQPETKVITGIVRPFPKRKGVLGGPTEGVGPKGVTVLQFLDPDRVPKPDYMTRLPFYVQTDSTDHPEIEAFVDRGMKPAQHREYMLTWYTLALCVTGLGLLWIYTRWRKLNAEQK